MSNLAMLISIFKDNFGYKFLEHVINDDCLVSGSLLPNFGIGKREFNDIDIYCPKICPNLEHYIEEELGGKLIICSDYFDMNNNMIRNVKYVTPYKPINIIYTNCSNSDEIKYYISRISDLTICISWFDGREYWLHPDVLRLVAHPINNKTIDQLIDGYEFNSTTESRTPEELYQYYIFKRKMRAVKYAELGFVIDMDHTLSKTELERVERSKEFNSKYEKLAKQAIFFCFYLYKLNCKRSEYNIIYTGTETSFPKMIEDLPTNFSSGKLKTISDKSINFRNFPPLKNWSASYSDWEKENQWKLLQWKEFVDKTLKDKSGTDILS